MTKPKTRPFAGAWMDGRVPVDLLRRQMRNWCMTINVDPVIAVLSRQHELWKFHTHQIAADPEPSQWASLLRAIKVPVSPSRMETDELRRKIRTMLPAQVIGVLNSELFKRAKVGAGELFDRMIEGDDGATTLLRATLKDMAEGARYVKGKRGPRLDVGPPFRAAHAAVMANSTMRDTDARVLAAELLRTCGIPAPLGRSQLASLVAAGQPKP